MGTTRGKLGNMVLYRAGGQERQRAYLSRIANPQTDAQTYARIRFRSAGVGYKAFKNASERLSISSKGATVYNAFIAKNRGIAPFHYKAFVEYCSQNGYSLPAPWQVANGPLITPSFLQDVSLAANLVSFSVRIPYNSVVEAGLTGSITAKQFLTLVWSFLGISSDIHICSSVGHCETDPSLAFEKPTYMRSNFHNLMEIWPDSDDLVSTPIFNVEEDGELVSIGTTIQGGIRLAGNAVHVGTDTWAPVAVSLNAASSVNILTFSFVDYPTDNPTLTQVGTFGAVWIANGSTKQTSTASYSLQTGITTAYNELLTDTWIASVIPSWRASGSSTNDGVYQG